MQLHRKILIGVCGGALTWLAGCSSSPHSPTEKYYLVATNIKIPYWQSANNGLMRAAQQIGVKAEMVGPDSFDPKSEHDHFQQVLAEKIKPAGIMVSVGDPAVIQPDIDAAIGQGIPVITVDSDAPASKRLTFVGTDNYKAGTMGAQLLVKQLQGKGDIVIYTMPEQPNLKDRLRGYHDVLEAHPGIKIIDTVDIKGDARIAFDRTQDLVDKKTIDKVQGFVCLEAIACPEVADVLDRNKVTGKVVVAMDTDQRTLDGIKKDRIAGTIAQKPFTMGYLGVALLDTMHHYPPNPLDKPWGQDPQSLVATFVDTGEMLVDKSNVDAFVTETSQKSQ
ncbi:MAG TPA: substrate-binding domain-containing protein [Bryobacteraceae bacterium]|nr:substrate-binding domain-containing protein [Bryobacteraceae bacterium]